MQARNGRYQQDSDWSGSMSIGLTTLERRSGCLSTRNVCPLLLCVREHQSSLDGDRGSMVVAWQGPPACACGREIAPESIG